MLDRLPTVPSPEQIRDRGEATVLAARTKISLARHDAWVARRRGHVRLWSLGAETLSRATELLSQTPAPLAPVVRPLRSLVDGQHRKITSPSIEGYDALNVRKIGRALDQMDLVALARVARYERSHKNRKTVFRDIERREGRLLSPPSRVAA